ncbi:unnamed protein product [Cylicocyclus nassatus]|uniref:3-demethylubiquinol 3-O-methyltransferase n=1 Tax=Cylicocyclus nassatus TaxID=53992 RepID=A0AA36M9L7_CYLNA|nr:unnamed protein product [Cylicocyclus nassatus]
MKSGLHSLNGLRVPWILQNLNEEDASVVDVGCGGGLLSIPLARAGLRVTGIDATEGAVNAARDALKSRPLQIAGVSDRITYHCATVESFSEEHEDEFDAVVASEIVEHVADLDAFVGGCARLAKPGAPLFFTTINRTLASRVLAIWVAENVVKVVPRGVHQYEKFVEPRELTELLERHGCNVRVINGFMYNPFTNHWSWCRSTAVNYGCLAIKN